MEEWYQVIKDACNMLPDVPRKIGIAMPGPFNYEAGISLIKYQDKFKSLYNINVKTALAKQLDIESDCILFMNDAACFLQGEVFCGAARNLNQVLGFTLGTGLGSAVYNNGLAVDAALWQSPFKNGIAEDYLSTHCSYFIAFCCRLFFVLEQPLFSKHLLSIRESTNTENIEIFGIGICLK